MRVLHLFDWYLPSTLSWVSRLLVHVSDFEVEVAAPWIVRDAFFHPELRHYWPPWQPSGLKPDSAREFALFRYLATRSQRFFPTYRAWLHQQIRERPPEIVHAHFGPTGCLYLPLARRLRRPLVVTFYGFDYKKLLIQRPVFRRKYPLLFEGAALVLTASNTGMQALMELGCPGHKLAVVRPSPDLAQFPLSRRRKQAGSLHLVQAATFTEKKGYETTLEAFRLALPRCPGMHLTLAGEPHDRALVSRLRAYIRRNGLADRVHWLPPVDHTQMDAFLSQFDAFIHPSCHSAMGDHEATPVVLLEAQATGLPVLSSRHFDLPDVVRDGYSGFLTDERDAPALADNICRLYDMPDEPYQQLRRQARAWVEQGFTVASSAARLTGLYRKLMDPIP